MKKTSATPLFMALAALCLASLSCSSGGSEPAANASSAVDLARLNESLVQLDTLLAGGQPARSAVEQSRRELQGFLDEAGPEGEFPVRESLDRVVGILSLSEGEVSAQQISQIRAEIRTMTESLQLIGVGAPSQPGM